AAPPNPTALPAGAHRALPVAWARRWVGIPAVARRTGQKLGRAVTAARKPEAAARSLVPRVPIRRMRAAPVQSLQRVITAPWVPGPRRIRPRSGRTLP